MRPNVIAPTGCCGFSGRSDFIYTKNSAIGRSDFIYTEIFAGPRSGFYLHKEYVGAILKKIVILLKENWSHMDNFKGAMLMKIVILLKENWSHMDKFSIYFKIFRDANS